MGIDIEHDFRETYEVIPTKEKNVAELKAAAKDADEILLATDPDREGEAIAWHVAEELDQDTDKAKRVEFHEITKKGVQHGIAHPRKLDKNLYDAQRSRRVLDRIVGYDVSALVWNKLAFGLSAGRVQSVALRLIVDREREIEAFVPEEYWNVGAALAPPTGGRRSSSSSRGSPARAARSSRSPTASSAGKVKSDLQTARYEVTEIKKSERKRNAPAPYTTSKLQQDAVNRLGFGAKRTMQVAQGLYEGVDLGKDGGTVGLITYMRTDSTRTSPEAVRRAREHIGQTYGAEFVPAEPNAFKSKKNTQDAHEAIRPTSLELTPESVRKHLKDEQYKLYKLIWDRFVASQMTDAVYDQTTCEIVGDAEGREDARRTISASSGRIAEVLRLARGVRKGRRARKGSSRARDEAEKAERGRRPAKTAASLEEAERGSARSPSCREGMPLDARRPPGRHRRAEVHAAAGALQ